MQLIAWACNAELASGCVGVLCTPLSHYVVKNKIEPTQFIIQIKITQKHVSNIYGGAPASQTPYFI